MPWKGQGLPFVLDNKWAVFLRGSGKVFVLHLLTGRSATLCLQGIENVHGDEQLELESACICQQFVYASTAGGAVVKWCPAVMERVYFLPSVRDEWTELDQCAFQVDVVADVEDGRADAPYFGGLYNLSTGSDDVVVTEQRKANWLLSATEREVFMAERFGALYIVDRLLSNKLPKPVLLQIGESVSTDEKEAADRTVDSAGISELCSGAAHSLFLDSKQRLYSFGCNRYNVTYIHSNCSHGELGQGNLISDLQPRLIDDFEGVAIAKLAVGRWHNVVLSESGDVYVWGWNRDGQLGFDKNAVPSAIQPYPLELDDAIKVVDVACGSRHTVLLTSDGSLFGSGFNEYEQLGKSHEEMDKLSGTEFKKITSDVRQVFAAAWTTLFV